MTRKTKVIVGLSGGVDSSVAALRLLQQGYDVEGLFMKNWEEDDDDAYCAAADDLKDAQSVAEDLEIVLHKVNFAREYWDRVFAYFLEEYRAGRTPNPDIMCNKEIKFKAFLDYAMSKGADFIATGHYARVDHADGSRLLRGIDRNKDQTYFLYALNQAQLRKSLFPVGELEKPAVRSIAAEAGFVTHNKKDSTGICFIGERRFRDFLARYLPAEPGPIVTVDGEAIGEHQGLMYYTLGQRQGLGIGGLKNANEEPWFVVDKRLNTRELIVAQGHDHPAMLQQHLNASQVSWTHSTPETAEFRCTAKVRYRQQDQECSVRLTDNGLSVTFDQAQRAITPGQSIVLYRDEHCLGGAIIDHGY